MGFDGRIDVRVKRMIESKGIILGLIYCRAAAVADTERRTEVNFLR